MYRIADPGELQAAYDASGRELVHVQAEGYDVFTRGLAIGPQTMVTHYDPTKPLHLRYQVDHHRGEEVRCALQEGMGRCRGAGLLLLTIPAPDELGLDRVSGPPLRGDD